MRILQLNAWMGKVEGGLKRLLTREKFDVICMQEVMRGDEKTKEHVRRLCFDMTQIQETSGLEYAFYSPNWGGKIADGKWEWGNLILSRIPIVERHSEFVSGEYRGDTVLGQTVGNNLNIQVARLENGVTIVNHHGYWCNQPMGDEKSVEAFRKAAGVVKRLEGPVVMCGDLNVMHEAPAMRELDFLRDLTHEYKVETTLSGLKHQLEIPCDHILVSKGIKVEEFRVFEQELASDHLPIVVKITT